jgi:tetratricopeptide (TPR) repeat protein
VATVSVATLRVPDKAWKHFTRAESCLERNQAGEADSEALKAIEIAPNFAAAYLLRANLAMRAHNFAGAIESAMRALRLEAGLPTAGILLAGAYNSSARYRDAAVILENLRGSEAESWQASYERARAATGLHDADAALHWSLRALDTTPASFADVHLIRANALMLACRWSEAAAQMQAYLTHEGPLTHRDQVLAALSVIQGRIATDEFANTSSR